MEFILIILITIDGWEGSIMLNIDDIDIEQVIDIPVMEKLLNSFILATDLGTIFLDKQGEFKIVPQNYYKKCEFCKIIQDTEKGKDRCKASMLKAGKQAAELGEPYIYRCHAGLIEFSAPIMFKDYYLGSVSCGPVLMWEWDELAIKELLDRSKDLDISRESLIVASRNLKVLSSKNVQAAADLLFVTANHIAQTGMLVLKHRKELNEQQAKLAEAVFERKKAEETLKVLERKAVGCEYPIEKEKELLNMVRIGDRISAKAILNDLLGSIFFEMAGNLEVIKARMLELLVGISRAAVEGGAKLEKLLGMNYNFISELSNIDSFELLCQWIVKVLDIFLDTVYETRNVKNAKILSDALDFINENYNTDLSLDKVAQSVFISPYYLSHLFKEELNITFVEYLTSVRIENAKKLLDSTPLSIVAIAYEVGYEDASYFSKVFKKTVGLSPSQFRKGL